MSQMIRAEDRPKLTELFDQELTAPVRLVLFTRRQSPIILPGVPACQWCLHTEQLVKEVAALSGMLSVEIHDFFNDEESVKAFGVDKIPALALIGVKDYGIRFYGIPSGYEFSALIEAILDAARGATDLGADIKDQLRALDHDVHIQVFSTPTCPHCPGAVRVAHQMAVESDHIRADAVEITEFPDLIDRYLVRGVPKVILNDRRTFEGALPPPVFLEHVLDAARLPGEI